MISESNTCVKSLEVTIALILDQSSKNESPCSAMPLSLCLIYVQSVRRNLRSSSVDYSEANEQDFNGPPIQDERLGPN